ncbi:GAF domain-containing protein [Massilia sp. H6]|uniref:GAF domain-containing protein n=1 Tax=Massilia sp. H6 TaxID=2970464 RepID=UPI002169D4F5|nr:GAF domain-containing protein [Massilia sp. H6]UVW28473.1 GAF domain-containing protein [Massilia sp. H6]
MTAPPDDDPILTTRDAALLLGVAVSTTQLWMESGALPAWKTPGGHRRVRLSSVRQLQMQQSEETGIAPECTTEGTALEAARLAALAASGLMDTPPEEVFDRLARLAAQLTDCPIALITLLGAQRQWFKARVGTDITETPREWAFCSHALAAAVAFVVADAQDDPRFAGNPLVTGEPHVRFYAGIPLADAQGRQLGTLCVFDREPRCLREREMRALHELAAIASEEIARRTQV